LSSPSLANITMPRHRQGKFFLDRTFAFIEGHPPAHAKPFVHEPIIAATASL
jgi:hypothetical protein